jgi:hypothetical protein
MQELRINAGNNGNSSGGNFCLYCRKSGHDKKDCFKLKKKDSRSNNGSTNNGHADWPNFDSQLHLRPLQVKKESVKTFGFVIVEIVGTTVCQLMECLTF